MARKSRRDKLAEQLDMRQQRAAYMLIENEMLSRTDPDFKTQDEIAEEVGVDRATLWRWRKQNQTFIAYRTEVMSDYLGDASGIFLNSLVASMKGTNGAPSMKALELYAKIQGLIKNEHAIEVTNGNNKTDEDIALELAQLDAQLKELSDGEDD